MKVEAKKIFTRTGVIALGVCGASFAFPAVAFASEAEAEAQEGIGVLLPNMAEFIPMLVAFLVLLFVLGKFGWPKFAAMLEKREENIRDSLEKSEAARIESERVLEEYKQQLAEAKLQAQQIVTDAKKAGEAAQADITAKAQEEATTMIAKAKAAIEVEKKAAIAELQSSVADTSIAVASKLIGEDLDDDEHRKIIERYVNEAGNLNAN